MIMKEYYVVGEYIEKTKAGGVSWEIAGVFDNQDGAEAACINDNYFVGPVPLNKPLPTERTIWPGVYYPNLQERP
jgi:hypothetical protein